MDALPITVFENILKYLNAIDQNNAIEALGYDSTQLGSHLNKNISLAFDYRIGGSQFNQLFSFRKHMVTYLDLTGIFWISTGVILRNCEKLINLEYLYLIGTSVPPLELERFHDLHKLKYVSVTENFSTSFIKKRNLPFPYSYANLLTVCVNDEGYDLLPILDNTWMCLMKPCTTAPELHQLLKNSFTEVLYTDFANAKSLDELLAGSMDIDVLLVRNSNVVRKSVNIEPIKNFTNLTMLSIEVTSVVGLMFLKPILLACRKLKKLWLDIQTEMFSFVHLKFAPPSLEDLSVKMSSALNFNIEKFFYDTSSNSNMHLRRLWLQCHAIQLETTVNLVTFMRDNPQLLLVVILCQTTNSKMSDIARLLKYYKKHPYQFFECKNRPVKNLPLQHLDMAQKHLQVVAHNNVQLYLK